MSETCNNSLLAGGVGVGYPIIGCESRDSSRWSVPKGKRLRQLRDGQNSWGCFHISRFYAVLEIRDRLDIFLTECFIKFASLQ